MAQQESTCPFVERVFEDFVAAMSLPMVVLGDRLGLYKAMAGAGPLTPSELAARTGTAERYVREWLSQQAAGGYVIYDGATDRFALPDEHAAVLADELSPLFLAGAFQLAFGYAHSARHVLKAFQLILLLDCLHDMGDPEAACRHIRAALEPDGTLLLVEPLAGDRLADNLTPLGRAYYAASTMNCVPTSLSQPRGLALGAQAGEARLRDIATRAGFSRFRRAIEAPFNLMIEARP